MTTSTVFLTQAMKSRKWHGSAVKLQLIFPVPQMHSEDLKERWRKRRKRKKMVKPNHDGIAAPNL